MSKWQDRISEEKIKQAIQDGIFDNLPGAGKPINWKDNPFTPEDWKMAFDLLKQNGFKLPWLEKRENIENACEQAFRSCQQNLQYRPDIARPEFFKQVEAINRMVFDYNLMVPSSQFQMLVYDARALFQKLKSDKPG